LTRSRSETGIEGVERNASQAGLNSSMTSFLNWAWSPRPLPCLVGGVWGHLVGDAVVVPYEFQSAEGIAARGPIRLEVAGARHHVHRRLDITDNMLGVDMRRERGRGSRYVGGLFAIGFS
jgi:hypothetical protein